MRCVYKAGRCKSGSIERASGRVSATRRARHIVLSTSFVYPRVSNALRNCHVARVYVKEIARFLNRSLPEKISQRVS